MRRSEPVGDCLRFTGSTDANGRGRIYNGSAVPALVYRVVFEHHHGPIPVGVRILHSCDHPWCIEIEHLHAGTQSDNLREMVARGRSRSARLSEDDVLAIRQDHRSSTVVAAEYGVNPSTIQRIWNGRTWTHLTSMVDG
jgi:hypothetical protein